MSRPILLCCAACVCLLLAGDPAAREWPMWGGTADRNMVSSMNGAPAAWDVKTGKNVKWVAKLGSQTYGNPVVAGGQVYVGTNNDPARNPKEDGDRSVLMCFRESDGAFLCSIPTRNWRRAGLRTGRTSERAPRLWWTAIACTM